MKNVVKESDIRRFVREELMRLREAAEYPESELEKAMTAASRLIDKGTDPLSIGWMLEKDGFMPNVVDAVMDRIA